MNNITSNQDGGGMQFGSHNKSARKYDTAYLKVKLKVGVFRSEKGSEPLKSRGVLCKVILRRQEGFNVVFKILLSN